MYYNVDFEICSAFFLLLFIVFTAKKGRGDFQSKIFLVYLASVFFNACVDVLASYTAEYHEFVPFWINYLLNTLFFVFQFLIPGLLSANLCLLVRKWRERISWLWILGSLPALLGLVLLCVNPWTRSIFYFDHNGYHQGPLHIYLYISFAIYALMMIILVLFSRNSMNKRQCAIAISIVVAGILPVALQFFFPRYLLSGMGTSTSVVIMVLTGERMNSYEDVTTGALNREAFSIHINRNSKNFVPLQIFVIALDNFKLVNEMYGMENGNLVMKMLVSALKKEYPQNVIFRLEGDIFAVALEEKTEGVMELERIRKIMRKPWHIEDMKLSLSACICLVHTIHHSDEEIFKAIDYAVMQAKKIGKGQFFEVGEEESEKMLRRSAIEHAMITAIEQGSFEVHYQPIYDVKSGRFHSMEALARLQVPEYGYVSPEEFITIAEQNGTILQIGMLVMEEVCKFIRGYNLKEKGIDFVEINLSVVQCMQDKIYYSIREVIEKYDIPFDMINLEITESVAAYSEERLIRNMARISLLDITFSLDDYGSGHSNVNYIVDLPFSIVKLDKHIVWAAVKKVTSRKILENTIQMFKDINLKVVAEGIEDREMADMVIDMGADYLQGYYYSKPVTKEKLMECLEDDFLEDK